MKALDAGADEAMFDKIDHYETSDLSESHKVALRLTDAYLVRPADLDDRLMVSGRRRSQQIRRPPLRLRLP